MMMITTTTMMMRVKKMISMQSVVYPIDDFSIAVKSDFSSTTRLHSISS